MLYIRITNDPLPLRFIQIKSVGSLWASLFASKFSHELSKRISVLVRIHQHQPVSDVVKERLVAANAFFLLFKQVSSMGLVGP